MKVGNMKAPNKLTCLNWMKIAWSSITTEMIVRCAEYLWTQTANEDSMTHHLKQEDVAAEAAAEVARLTSSLAIPVTRTTQIHSLTWTLTLGKRMKTSYRPTNLSCPKTN